MPSRDARIDAYIEKAADFAKPILRHLRKQVHEAAPQIEETIKWSFPNFEYKGLVCSMAAFKSHCSFGFWKSPLVLGGTRHDGKAHESGMGQFGRITSLGDLPKDSELNKYIREAVRLNEEGVKMPPRKRSAAKKELVVPEYFMTALRKNKKALAAFEGFSYSHKKEYLEWITEAKREETRARRIKTALEWMAEGKPRNWKYMNC